MSAVQNDATTPIATTPFVTITTSLCLENASIIRHHPLDAFLRQVDNHGMLLPRASSSRPLLCSPFLIRHINLALLILAARLQHHESGIEIRLESIREHL